MKFGVSEAKCFGQNSDFPLFRPKYFGPAEIRSNTDCVIDKCELNLAGIAGASATLLHTLAFPELLRATYYNFSVEYSVSPDRRVTEYRPREVVAVAREAQGATRYVCAVRVA